MHRITFTLATTAQWYAVMREARSLYGTSWRSQPHVKRKLERSKYNMQPIQVWFEVPDSKFATWVAVKLAVIAEPAPNK